MSMTGLDTFDTTVQKTENWLREISERIGGVDRYQAYHALRAVLITVRDRLTVEEAADFSAQLPILVRGVFFDGWRPATVPVKMRSKEEFLSHVGSYYKNAPVDLERITRAVLQVIKRHVTKGEVDQVVSQMPDNIRTLWE